MKSIPVSLSQKYFSASKEIDSNLNSPPNPKKSKSHKRRYNWTPIDHPDRTKFMSENYQAQFNKLHKHDQYLLKLFWGLKGKTRFCVLSYSEIGKLLGLSRKSAISFMARL